jgi:hypothetical protein
VIFVADTQAALQIAVANLAQLECSELLHDCWNGSFFDHNRSSASLYVFHGYVNGLGSPSNRDALGRRCELRPVVHEMKPGGVARTWGASARSRANNCASVRWRSH